MPLCVRLCVRSDKADVLLQTGVLWLICQITFYTVYGFLIEKKGKYLQYKQQRYPVTYKSDALVLTVTAE